MRKCDCFGNVNGSINNRPNPFLYSITLNFIIPGKIDIIQQITRNYQREERVARKLRWYTKRWDGTRYKVASSEYHELREAGGYQEVPKAEASFSLSSDWTSEAIQFRLEDWQNLGLRKISHFGGIRYVLGGPTGMQGHYATSLMSDGFRLAASATFQKITPGIPMVRVHQQRIDSFSFLSWTICTLPLSCVC